MRSTDAPTSYSIAPLVIRKEPKMDGQMCWLSRFGADGEKILHLRLGPNQPWLPYTALPGYAVPDYQVPKGSKGWATYQKLMKAGWTLIPTAQAQVSSRLATQVAVPSATQV